MEREEEDQTLSTEKDCCDFEKKIQDMKNTLLLQGVRAGHVDCVKKALREGADVNATEISLEDTAKSVYDILRQFDIPLDYYYIWETYYPGVYGEPAIGVAVLNDKQECLELLIKAGADVNSRLSNDFTLLMYAAHKENLTFVNLLIEAGADVNSRCSNGYTPLMLAAQSGNQTSVDLLIEAGADVNAQTGAKENGDTALILAAKNHAPQCAESLIAAGADLNKLGRNDCTALVEAIWSNGDPCVDLLIKSGADVNISNTFSGNPLLSAVGQGCSHYVEQLIKAGADVNYRGSILLYFAANKGSLTTLQSLFKAGITINTPPPSVLTCYLKNSIEQKQTDIVLILAAAGEKIDETKVRSIPEYLKPKESCLKHLCRDAVRNHLLELDPHTHLFNRVPRLGLPSLITEYLLYNVSLDDSFQEGDPMD